MSLKAKVQPFYFLFPYCIAEHERHQEATAVTQAELSSVVLVNAVHLVLEMITPQQQ